MLVWLFDRACLVDGAAVGNHGGNRTAQLANRSLAAHPRWYTGGLVHSDVRNEIDRTNVF